MKIFFWGDFLGRTSKRYWIGCRGCIRDVKTKVKIQIVLDFGPTFDFTITDKYLGIMGCPSIISSSMGCLMEYLSGLVLPP